MLWEVRAARHRDRQPPLPYKWIVAANDPDAALEYALAEARMSRDQIIGRPIINAIQSGVYRIRGRIAV